jgi:hypothetical protein
MSNEEFRDFTEENWGELTYFDIESLDKTRSKGFYTKSVGLYIFSIIYRFVECEVKDGFNISDDNWQMSFTME